MALRKCFSLNNHLPIYLIPRTGIAGSINSRGIKKLPLEELDGRIDEQFHFPPMGEGDTPMQTRVTFLSKDMMEDRRVGVRCVSPVGFRLMDMSFLYGPVALFPRTALSWRVAKVRDITPESLELFLILQPKLDVLIIGAGDRKNVDVVRTNLCQTLNKHRIGYEIMTTEDAIGSFNFLNNEARYVAAGLYPPEDMPVGLTAYNSALNLFKTWHQVPDIPNSLVSVMFGFMPALGQDELINVCMRIWGTNTPEAWKAVETFQKIREIRRQQRISYNEDVMKRQLEERKNDLKLLAAKAQMRKKLELKKYDNLLESNETNSTSKK